jgi:hypothetical protein
MDKKEIHPSSYAPAFPQPSNSENQFACHFGYGGMTIREHFASLAMQGILSNSDISMTPEDCADASLMYADALINKLNSNES